MTAPSLWFERKFTFDIPVERAPTVLERLRGTPARIEERTGSLAPDVLTRRTGEHWSVQEQVGHLLDLEDLWYDRLDDFDAGGATLRPADLKNRRTHDANHNARALADLLREFRAARSRFIARLDAYPADAWSRTALHPRLQQPMRLIDHAFFVAEHDDHHMALISWLLKQS